ncbi:MAG: NUDIX hydrolase [Chloroflexi bacterium]|nr:NUDIX hydrolase [Chloroflexota bacterium]
MAEREPIQFCSTCGSKVEQRQAFGQLRPVCSSCGRVHFLDPKVGAGVLLSKDDKILLVRRAVEPELGKWTIPAGFVEGDEDPKDTAIRECKEETGLEVRIVSILDVIHGREHSSGASIVIIYTGEIIGGDLIAGDDADAADFFVPSKLPPLAFEATRVAIEGWKSQV